MPIDPITIGTLAATLVGGLLPSRSPKLAREQKDLLTSQTKGQDIENILQQLLLGRRQQQNPLFAALSQGAFRGLPVYAQEGIDPSSLIDGVRDIPATGGRPRRGRESTGRAVPRVEY